MKRMIEICETIVFALIRKAGEKKEEIKKQVILGEGEGTGDDNFAENN